MDSSTQQTDAVIIGAGVIGASIAAELSRRGHRTINVERGESAGCGSTSSSSAVVRFSYSTAAGVNLSWEGLHYWKNWAEHIGVCDEQGLVTYRQTGQLMMKRFDGDFTSIVRSLWQDLDIPFEDLSLQQMNERMPWFDTGTYGPPTVPDDDAFWKDATGSITGAILSPDAGYISDPQLAAHNLQCAAEAAGGQFLFGAEVTSIQRNAERVCGVVLADGRTISAPVIINVAGPHSAAINRMAGVYESMAIKTAPMRQEVHHVPAPSGVNFQADGFVMADDDIGYYMRPEVGNNVLIGSLEPECDDLEWVEDPDAIRHDVTAELWETQVLRVNRRIPDLGVPHQRRGAVGVYDVSDDWMPIYDRTDLDGFYVAIGSSGNQFKNAGVAGTVMADVIEAVEAGHDQDADPIELRGRYTDRLLPTAPFSRNRVINADSSMSVQG